VRSVALGLISLYQRVLSPLKGPTCRFRPTCSEYAAEAIERYGVMYGGLLTVKRLMRCHPFSRGGYDPLNDRAEDD